MPPTGLALEASRIAAGGLHLNVAIGPPNGPPLVVLHGLMRRWQYTAPLLERLIANWQLFAFDLRGHGRSDWAPDGYRHYQNYVPDVVAVLDSQLDQPAVLLGHSLGGLIALGTAAACPERCRAVIAAEAPLTPASILDTLRLGAWAWVPQLAGRPPDQLFGLLRLLDRDADDRYLRETAAALHALDPATVQYWAEDRMQELLVDYDVDVTLGRLRCPLLLVQADPAHGAVMTDADLALARRRHAPVAVTRVLGANHELGLDRAAVDPWLGAMAPFLAGHRGSASKPVGAEWESSATSSTAPDDTETLPPE